MGDLIDNALFYGDIAKFNIFLPKFYFAKPLTESQNWCYTTFYSIVW